MKRNLDRKLKVTVEIMTIDNLAKVYMLWLEHQKEYLDGHPYFKDTDSRKKHYINLFSSYLNNKDYVCKVARKGKDIIGFLVGYYINRFLEPKFIFNLDFIYVLPKYRHMDVANAMLDDLKLDMRIVGATHIEGNTSKKLIDGLFKDYNIIEYRISTEI